MDPLDNLVRLMDRHFTYQFVTECEVVGKGKSVELHSTHRAYAINLFAAFAGQKYLLVRKIPTGKLMNLSRGGGGVRGGGVLIYGPLYSNFSLIQSSIIQFCSLICTKINSKLGTNVNIPIQIDSIIKSKSVQ